MYLILVSGCGGSAPAAAECHRSFVTTESGLRLKDLVCGEGAEATGGASVTVEYSASVQGGDEFDSSADSGPLAFPLGRGQVIEGFDEGVAGMRVGGRRRLVIPPELTYGDAGLPPDVAADATLIFDVELIEVNPA